MKWIELVQRKDRIFREMWWRLNSWTPVETLKGNCWTETIQESLWTRSASQTIYSMQDLSEFSTSNCIISNLLSFFSGTFLSPLPSPLPSFFWRVSFHSCFPQSFLSFFSLDLRLHIFVLVKRNVSVQWKVWEIRYANLPQQAAHLKDSRKYHTNIEGFMNILNAEKSIPLSTSYVRPSLW